MVNERETGPFGRGYIYFDIFYSLRNIVRSFTKTDGSLRKLKFEAHATEIITIKTSAKKEYLEGA
ncbi:hypothetical protein C7460_105190 [Marinoscillum furvescens DSM 4134]|uniref:Uncharacterized protein n=1 Tax=Marinoscillum furvescens DSM 4134 TaxID=1122208 RepID=A0A3D9L768_MARFU|nr:hypothetical protein C7460_105190 [Marinoscillum furvescens DSM 4134]